MSNAAERKKQLEKLKIKYGTETLAMAVSKEIEKSNGSAELHFDPNALPTTEMAGKLEELATKIEKKVGDEHTRLKGLAGEIEGLVNTFKEPLLGAEEEFSFPEGWPEGNNDQEKMAELVSAAKKAYKEAPSNLQLLIKYYWCQKTLNTHKPTQDQQADDAILDKELFKTHIPDYIKLDGQYNGLLNGRTYNEDMEAFRTNDTALTKAKDNWEKYKKQYEDLNAEINTTGLDIKKKNREINQCKAELQKKIRSIPTGPHHYRRPDPGQKILEGDIRKLKKELKLAKEQHQTALSKRSELFFSALQQLPKAEQQDFIKENISSFQKIELTKDEDIFKQRRQLVEKSYEQATKTIGNIQRAGTVKDVEQFLVDDPRTAEAIKSLEGDRKNKITEIQTKVSDLNTDSSDKAALLKEISDLTNTVIQFYPETKGELTKVQETLGKKDELGDTDFEQLQHDISAAKGALNKKEYTLINLLKNQAIARDEAQQRVQMIIRERLKMEEAASLKEGVQGVPLSERLQTLIQASKHPELSTKEKAEIETKIELVKAIDKLSLENNPDLFLAKVRGEKTYAHLIQGQPMSFKQIKALLIEQGYNRAASNLKETADGRLKNLPACLQDQRSYKAGIARGLGSLALNPVSSVLEGMYLGASKLHSWATGSTKVKNEVISNHLDQKHGQRISQETIKKFCVKLTDPHPTALKSTTNSSQNNSALEEVLRQGQQQPR